MATDLARPIKELIKRVTKNKGQIKIKVKLKNMTHFISIKVISSDLTSIQILQHYPLNKGLYCKFDHLPIPL